jgi:HlyD family secretion protein
MPRKSKRRRWIIIVILIVFVIVVGNSLRGGERAAQPVKAVKVETGAIVRRLAETGTIEMDRTVEVKSLVAGRIINLLADVGDVVEAGQLLSIIEPDPNKALQLSGKRASVTRAVMELTEQQRQLAQKRQSFMDGLIAKEEIERAEYLFAIAESGLAQQRLELQILEREVRAQARAIRATEDSLLLEDYEIYSPMNGVVTTRPVEEGELVTSAVSMNQGSILFTVGDPNRLIVKVRISEVDIGEAREGLDAEITVDAIPGETFLGLLRHVAPTGGIGQGSSIVSFDAEVEVLENDPRLRAGMTADVDIIIGRLEDAPYLPVEAVAVVYKSDDEGNDTLKIDRRVTFIRNGEGWQERVVTTGLESNTRIQILDGLEVGDEVHPDAEARLERESENDRTGPGVGGRRGERR